MYISLTKIHTVKPQYQHLINLFAYGTYKDYIQKKYEVSELNEKQTHTLRRLSILSAIKGVEVHPLSSRPQLSSNFKQS